jgi:hypothetical protein
MLLLALAAGCLMQDAPKNLVVNGDFKNGRRGFQTSYGLSDDMVGDGTYWIGSDPKKKHKGAISIHDHTSGHSNMLVLNGSATQNLAFWVENIKVEPNHRYHFSGWAASWSKNPLDQTDTDYSPARILVRINGKPIGPEFRVDAKAGNWTKFEFDWDSGDQKLAKIRLYDQNLDIVGNDFAIDDLAFVASN